MRKILLLFFIVLTVFKGFSQDQSNKGKDFWFAYPAHSSGTVSRLAIYLTSDVNTTGTVSFNGNSIPFTVAANQTSIVRIGNATIPSNAGCYVASNNVVEKNRAIHIESANPVAAYAHVLNASISGSTLLLPVNVMGKEYVVSTYVPQGSTFGSERCQFEVVGIEDNTTVEINPVNSDVSGAHTAGIPFQIVINKGDVYQYQSLNELSGTTVKSIASGSNSCQRIVVIGSSTRTAMGCGGASSGDNLFQQLTPKSSWGRRYLTSPFALKNHDIIRVYVSSPTSVVNVNGTPLSAATLISNSYYEFTASTPQDISSVDQIAVYQYITTQNCDGIPSDPEMILINPVEQTLSDIAFVSAHQSLTPPNTNITSHYLNLILQNTGTSISSLRVDGVAPAVTFTPIGTTGYSYATVNLTASTTVGSPSHRVVNDSGFIAIAYGYGGTESYGYNAGTNVIDLNQQLEVTPPYSIETTPNVCVGVPFDFKVYLPNKTVGATPDFIRYDSIRWDCSNTSVMSPNNFPYVVHGTPTVTPDSVNIRNTKEVAWYSVPGQYTFSTPGVYNITITVYRSTTEGCGNQQDYTFQLTVTGPPVPPGFTASNVGCYLQQVDFTETTPQAPKPTYLWTWNFNDPASGASNTSTIRNPSHTFTGPGSYNVQYSAYTTVGCQATYQQTVVVPDVPNATINGTVTVCINSASPTITLTGTGGLAPYIMNYSINGVGQAPVTSDAAGVYTITGIPTNVAGTFVYTLDSIKNVGAAVCKRIVTGQSATVTVTGDATLTLTSAAGTNTQTVCINNAITNITYAVGGTGTGGAVTGLPAGVTGTYAGGVITITGTPTVSGTFPYTVSTTGPCVKPSLGGTLTVSADGTLALSSAAGTNAQTVCINNTLTNITYTAGGSVTGATVTGLPAGVTGTYAGGVVTILGTPSAAGTFTYTITTTGPCVKPTATGTITVTADATLTLSSAAGTNAQTVCINNAITNITYAVGGTGTGGAVTGLPAGVTGTYAGGVITITGTPTVAGTFNYTVSTTGPCAKPSLGGTLTVNADATIALTSAAGSNNQTICINNGITTITYSVGGGGTGATVTGLPAGVTGTYSGGVVTILGSPTVTGTFNYTVTTTGPCIKPTATGSITITGDATLTLTSAAGTNAQTVCINNAITNITYAVGGTGTGGAVTGLPAGVTGTYAGGIITITGTPTVSGTFPYTVSTTGPCAKPTLGGTLTVTADGTLSLSSAVGTNAQTVCINTPLTNITYAAGGSLTGATVTGLPTGVTGSYAGGVVTILGSPSVAGTFTYTVTTAGPCVKPTATGTITVTADATLTLTSAAGTNTQTVCVNNAITNITYAVGGTGTGGAVAGLPAGVTGTYAGGVITITGTPTVSGTFNYTVSTTGPCAKPSLGGTLTVNADATIALTSAAGSNNQTICINNSIATITYSVGGGGTGATVTGLPAGLTGTYSGGVVTILGSPTVTGTFNYTVTTTGPCIKPTATGSITITGDATLTLTSAAGTNAQTVCINNAITNITYAVGGTGTGGAVTGLPAGVTGTYAGGVITITGTPTVSGTFPYTVTTTGPCVKPTLGGTLTVNADATLSLSSAAGTNAQTVCVNTAITNITYAVGGGGTGGTVTGLPAGVTGSYSGGTITITGTPSVSGTFTYTVTTTGPCVKPSTTGTITINPLPTALIAGNTEVCQNAPSVAITFTGASGTAPYTFTYSVNGGADQTVTTTAGNSVTVLQTTAVANTFTYVLKSVKDGTSTGCSQLQSGTVVVKVNPLPTATISGDKLICINTPYPDITFTGAGGSTPYTFRYRINGGGLQTVTTTGTNTSVTVLVPTVAAGTFTYTLEDVRDGSTTACLQAQTGTATVTISDVLPAPAFIFSDPVCLPKAVVQFQNQTTIANNTAMTYLWNFGDGSANSTALNPTHTYVTNGPFPVTLQATSNAGCVKTYSVPVNSIHPQPKADFSISNPGGVCIGSDVTFRDQTDPKDGLVTTWNWDLGDGTKLGTNPVTYRYASATTYSVTLFTVNSFGCNSDTITKTFTVHPYPVVDAGPDGIVLEGGSYTLQPVVSGSTTYQYLWSPPTYLSSTTDMAPTANIIMDDITYTLTVTGTGGCTAAPDKVFIKVLKAPKIPNTFTPNGDGINELWLIDYLDTYPNNRVQVFTRTGQLVFESKGYKKPWDGKLNGKPLPFDTYYYIIEPGNSRAPITGYVTIVK
ncbi:PKD domain-containing protein [Ferruginibacter sp.]